MAEAYGGDSRACCAAVLTRNVRDFALTPVRVETY
jgi:hypothetical protein